MITIDYVRHSGTPVFQEETVFRFTPGVTLISGANLNREGASANAVGKTALMSPIHGLVFDETIYSSRVGAKRPPGSVEELGFTSVDGQDVVVRVRGGKSTKVELTYDGKALPTKKKSAISDFLRRAWPQSPAIYWQTCLLSPSNPWSGMLIKGQGNDRLKFFEELFNLDTLITEVKERVKSSADQILDANAEYAALEEDLAALPDPTDLKATKAKLAKMESWLKKYARVISSSARSYERIAPVLELVEGLTDDYSLSNFKTDHRDEKEVLAKWKADHAAWVSAKEAYAAWQAMDKSLSLLRSKVISDKPIDTKKTEKSIGELDRMVESVKAEMDNLRPIVATWAELSAEPCLVQDIDEVLNEYDALAARSAATKSMLRDVKATLKSGVHGKCPTCAQVIDEAKLKANEAALAAQSKELLEKREGLARKIVTHWGWLNKSLDVLHRNVKKAREKLECSRRSNEALAELKRIGAAEPPKGGEPGKPPAKPGLTPWLDNDVKAMLSVYGTVGGIRQAADTFAKVDPDKYSKVNTAFNTLLSEYNDNRRANKEREYIKAKLDELEPEVKGVEVWTALKKIFGSKDLKVKVLTHYFSLYVDLLNEHKDAFFPEPVEFDINVETGSILITHEGKDPVDIRTLSGQEARSFMFLNVLATRILLPEESKADFLVIDEIDANMDKAMLEWILNVAVPYLGQFIPKIVIISPKDLSEYEKDYRVVTVIKEGSNSKMVEGYYA